MCGDKGGKKWRPTGCLEAVGCWLPRQADQMEVWQQQQQQQFPLRLWGVGWPRWSGAGAAAGALEGDRQGG